MRKDTIVEFITETGGEVYNPETGGMDPAESVKEKRLCAVSDLSTERAVELFGRVDERAISLHYPGPKIDAQRLVIAEGRFKGEYTIVTTRSLRNKQTVIAKEMKP